MISESVALTAAHYSYIEGKLANEANFFIGWFEIN